MQFSRWLLVITIIQTGLSIGLMDNDIRSIYKTRMNKRTFEIIKNLHLNWYIYSIKALLGQVGRQMYRQLTEDEQKKLASCLDHIEDERDLVAGAKCLLQARHEVHFRTYRQDFEQGQTPDKIDVTSAFITTSSEEEESLINHDYERKNVGRYDEMDIKEKASHSSRSGFGNKFLLYSPETSSQFSKFSNILDLDHMKNLIPYTFHTFEYLINSSSISDLSHQQKLRMSRQMYLNQLLHTNKSRHILTPEENSIEGSETSKTLYLVENEIKKTSNLAGQYFNPSHYGKVRRMRKEMQYSKKSRLNKNTDISAKHRNFRKDLQKSGWYGSVSISPSERKKKLYSNLTKFLKEKLWQRRRGSHRFNADHVMKSEHLIVNVKKSDKMPAMHDSIVEKTLIQRMSKFISVMLSGKEAGGNWTKTYEEITELKKQMDQQLGSNNARVYNLRLFDLVLDNKKRTRPKIQFKYKNFISMAFGLLNGINRNRKKDELNFRFLSPRLMSLMPDKMQSRNRILSPSILSFYKDDSPDSIVSLPKLLEKSGMMEKDRQAVLEMVMDVSGARIAVEMISDVFKETNATGRINRAFRSLEKSFSIEQRNEMESRGFTFLDASQLKKMLHQQGIMKLEDIKFDLEKYEQLNRKQREEALWENIKQIAKNETEEEYRKKRQTISVLTPTILSPFMFSPIFGLSILGPVVLSPSIFSPLILNPSILSPYVLSPGIFLPFLISPYILSPYVLSPLVGAPYILSPYVLSPNVINPYLLSPLVLSPYILSPDIISPQALGGQILSPYAFSPSIYTDSVLMVSILSPSWMSK